MLLLTIFTATPLDVVVTSTIKPQLIAANWGMLSGKWNQDKLRGKKQENLI